MPPTLSHTSYPAPRSLRPSTAGCNSDRNQATCWNMTCAFAMWHNQKFHRHWERRVEKGYRFSTTWRHANTGTVHQCYLETYKYRHSTAMLPGDRQTQAEYFSVTWRYTNTGTVYQCYLETRKYRHSSSSYAIAVSLNVVWVTDSVIKDEACLFYIRTQCVPRSKHSPLRL
jgi:hypothetical protein